jgi:hypothetical protein
MAAKFDFGSLDQPFEADWPVTVSEPRDGGKFVESMFTARLRQIPHDEAMAAINAEGFDALTLPRLYFVGLAPSEGFQLTDDQKEQMLGRAHVRNALDKAYQSFNTGVAAKN